MEIDLTDIQKYLDNNGIKHSNNGYRYIIMAIQLGNDYPEMLVRINDIYKEIADKYDKKPKNIENSIRNALKSTKQSNEEFIEKAIILIGLRKNSS